MLGLTMIFSILLQKNKEYVSIAKGGFMGEICITLLFDIQNVFKCIQNILKCILSKVFQYFLKSVNC